MGRENKNILSQLYMPFKINIIALERGDASAPLQMFCAAKQTWQLKIMLTIASKETNREAIQSHYPCSSKADSPSSYSLNITWQLFLLTCAPWSNQKLEHARDRSGRKQIWHGLTCRRAQKITVGNKKRSTLETAHASKQKELPHIT